MALISGSSCIPGLHAQHPHEKKGVAIVSNSLNDANTALMDTMNLSWYYNWQIYPNGNYDGSMEYVPMIWGNYPGYTGDAALEYLKNSPYTTLLGFNEPDQKRQANMSVDRAISLWPKLMCTGKRLGSPALASKHNTTGGWLKRFMNQCDDLDYRVDFICVHIYQQEPNLNYVLNYLEEVHELYGLPIWITEWSLVDWDGNNMKGEAAQAAYLKRVAEALEKIPYLERHAWFMMEDGYIDNALWDMGLVNPQAETLSLVGEQMKDLFHSSDPFDPEKKYSVEIITLNQQNREPVAGSRVEFDGKEAYSNTEGAVHMDSANYGWYSSSIFARGYRPVETKWVKVARDTAFTILLKDSLNLVELTLRDEKTGNPLEGCLVEFAGEVKVTDDTGLIRLEKVVFGRHDLSANADGYHPLLVPRIKIDSDTALTVYLQKDYLDASLKIRDRATGDPVNRAVITFTGAVALTNVTGEVTLEVMEPGSQAIDVRHEDFFPHSDTMVVQEDTSIVVDLTRKLADIRFEISDTAGPLEGVAIEINGFRFKTNVSGMVWFSRQPARQEYSYQVEVPGSHPLNDIFFLEVDTTIFLRFDQGTGFSDHPLDGMRIFPNPASEKIRVLSPVEIILRIADLDGRLIRKEKLEAPGGEFDVSGLPEGCYITEVRHGHHRRFQRIMILR
jgi:hypothetical protein